MLRIHRRSITRLAGRACASCRSITKPRSCIIACATGLSGSGPCSTCTAWPSRGVRHHCTGRTAPCRRSHQPAAGCRRRRWPALAREALRAPVLRARGRCSFPEGGAKGGAHLMPAGSNDAPVRLASASLHGPSKPFCPTTGFCGYFRVNLNMGGLIKFGKPPEWGMRAIPA
jgi:hypothetical protein